MPTNQPQLGSVAIYTPKSTRTIQVSADTCHDLSLFKEILKEYRKLDDTIVVRLNRANAAMRDQDRMHSSSSTENFQDQACAYLWRELVDNWKRRTQLVQFCSSVVDQSLAEKRASLADSTDAATQRKTQASIFEEQVKRNHVHNELTVETIVRKRAVEAFRSRCQYFVPPRTDEEARQLWDQAQR
ncbi:caffeine-induced death protein 2-domain-containing protein [Panaeolus papilionaceus]|nr:caffeine-induced death protein 2-domain-containing protein [Panaeolus papilionaceus]